MPHAYSEDRLIEQPAIALFAGLGWQTVNAFHETFGAGGTLGREHAGEVVLARHLVPARKKLNPKAAPVTVRAVVNELVRDMLPPGLALNPSAINLSSRKLEP